MNAQSVGNKHAAVCDRIASGCLDLCVVVETWHVSADSTQLIACEPLGYCFVEKARPRTESALQTMRTNHGGICLFYTSTISAREVRCPSVNPESKHSLCIYLYALRDILRWSSFSTDLVQTR